MPHGGGVARYAAAMPAPFPLQRVKLARWIAIAADALQIGLVPLWLTPPVAAGVNAAIDVVVCVILCFVLRPHWAFAPTFVIEMLPVVDVIPLWWASVLFVTRDTPQRNEPHDQPEG